MRWLLAIAALAVIAFNAHAETLSLSGTDWWIRADADGKGAEQKWFSAAAPAEGWIPAQVPGNIQADLEAAHQLRPLWYGGIDPNLYEVARKDWWYRKDVIVPESFAGKRLTLVFDGVDERCEVWCNGRKLGANAGMFRRFSFDVSGVVSPGRTNQLALCLGRMPDELMPWMIHSDGPDIPGQKYWFLNGIHRTRALLKDLKTAGNWGWDWSVNLWTLGIWKNVRLEASGPARMEWTRVESVLTPDLGRATVRVALDIDSVAATAAEVRFRVSGHGAPVIKFIAAALKQGTNRVETELQIDNPALWWPNGHGDQPLYTLEASIEVGGVSSDVRSTRFGIRDLRWELTEGAPAGFPSAYQLVINHRPVRTLGTGVILPYALPGCGLPHELHLLRLAKAAGMNYIRINGGGGAPLFDSPWYDLADELGLMISYEFPFANAWDYDVYQKDPVFLANLETTCRDIIRQSRNHPSIIEYVGGNEVGWQITDTHHPALNVMKKLAPEESDRVFRATCPDIGAKHSPWTFDVRSSYHFYDTVETMRYGEFGTCSPAVLEVWQRDIPPASRWPINLDDPILIRKNAVQAVFSKDIWCNKRQIMWTFGPRNLPDFIRAGQYLGAEGLRYAYDALRRKGKRIGGVTNHCYSEPWPNAAGSALVDFDGRTYQNYDFVKQALAPITLSLKFDNVLYQPDEGINAELFIVSDAPAAAEGLQWRWLARDQVGTVFAHGEGTTAIEPLEVKSLTPIALKPAGPAAEGLVFVELQLLNAAGKLLTERVQIFAPSGTRFAGLLGYGAGADSVEMADGKANLAFVDNGARPATASSERPEPHHRAVGINDGRYGNERSWIGTAPNASFQIDLGEPALVGRFKIGRDRTGTLADRQPDAVKIEASLDGRAWQTVCDHTGLTKLPGFSPEATTAVSVKPVRTKFVKVTVNAAPSAPEHELACIDEFEVYAPLDDLATPGVAFEEPPQVSALAIARAALQATTAAIRYDGENEVRDLSITNTGPMTALFCEPHPLLVYRTDLIIDNNHCCIPPGETRVISIRAPRRARCGLTLAHTGWRISCWNAGEVMIAPSEDVLLSVGRWDKMCQEFIGGSPVLAGDKVVTHEFAAPASGPARLRIHTADQSPEPAVVGVSINGRMIERALPAGMGIQRADPYHLAYPATLEFDLLETDIRSGTNRLEIRVSNGGWFSWDALDLVRTRPD